jgi:hypothetical protein
LDHEPYSQSDLDSRRVEACVLEIDEVGDQQSVRHDQGGAGDAVRDEGQAEG